METPTTSTGAPPRMMNAIIAGFNVAANHLGLLILPVIVDLFLWLGPHISLKDVLLPAVTKASLYLQQANPPDLTGRINGAQDIWTQILASFNLFSLIRTFPIGVPSLMATSGSTETPYGPAVTIEASSGGSAFLIWLAVITVGFIAGCLYFYFLAQATLDTKQPFELSAFFNKIGQAFLFSVGLFLLIIFLAIPGLLLASIIALISPALGDFAILFGGFILIWILFPLVFTPQALFSGKNNILVSTMTSVRLVRYFLPGAGFFLIIALIFTQGLDILWRVPPASSWMTLVGILGHSFIYTAILAASFVYFQGGLRWMLERIETARPQEIKT